ncbi:RE1 [Symbiodinium sp. CCMP2592]|nr:RE1 [Symbiodinium sp. CCMP2592]
MALMKLRKEQLKEKLAELGEQTPTKWTKKEIVMRILELDQAAGETPKKVVTDLQSRIRELGVASRKKSTLEAYCQQIGVVTSCNHTMYTLEQAALRRLYDISEPAGEDVVGFGKHSTETYMDIYRERHNYADWVKKTAQETDETDYRLRRLANWLERQADKEAEMIPVNKPKAKARAPPSPPASTARASTDATHELLQAMMTTVQGLQQEVQELRAERPRKEVRASNSETESAANSYQMDDSVVLSKETAALVEHQAWSLERAGRDSAAIRCADWNGRDNKLSRRGWKAYVHSKDEGVEGLSEDTYTSEFADRVTQMVLQEHNYVGVLSELRGKPELPEAFGNGLHCICELTQGREVLPDGTERVGQLHKTMHQVVQFPPKVLSLAKEFRCSVCEEKRRVQPRHLASLEPLPPKWHCVSADIGHYYNVHKKEHVQFMMIVDEGSRFKAARVLTVGSKQQPTGAACLEYLRDGWISYFGAPRTLRLDPAGAFRGAAVEEFCDRHQIFLDVIPGEAHWKVSVVEQAVKGTKELISKLLEDEPELDTREALAVAVRTFNQREIIRGFTPTQHALGQAPDISGRMDFSGKAMPPELLVENPTGEFARSIERQRTAEQALSEWQAKQRLSRAAHSRGRRVLDFVPGELVFFWRSQVSGQSRREPGDRHGQFLGPARVLATETKRDDQGHLMPSSSVWLVRGRSLLKCAAEQVRRASAREELIESLNQTDPVPWTYTRVAEQIGGSKYQDITEAVPEHEWTRAQDVEQEVQPTRRRIGQKRSQDEVARATSYGRARDNRGDEDGEEPPPREGQRATASRSSPYSRPSNSSGGQWWSEVQEALWSDDTAYWNDRQAAIEVEVALPESKQGLDKACRDLPTYFMNSMKKRAVEVSEKRLTDEERALFRSAKLVEVKNFVAAQAFETIPEGQRPSKEQAVNMRWILTWKQKEDGSVKPKARAVLLGYQDPAYEHRATTAPVMSRQTRQLVLQIAANRNWRVAKGDVSGAFLQGREYPDTLYCIPCPEICEALGIPHESITRLRRACYGLVDAPLEWHKTVDEFLGSLQLERTWSDACCWVLREQDTVIGIITGHVDDFLFTGDEQHPKWQQTIKAIKERFQWGDWDYDDFVQCGVNIKRTASGFELSQPRYIDSVKEIPVNASRRKQPTQATTERERSQLRALLGAISWHAQQVAPHLSAEVSLLLSEVSQSDGETIAKANACLRRARAAKDHVMKIHAFRNGEDLGLYGWVDAGNQNRVDGYSTQGIFIGVAPTTLLQGELCPISPVAWHSNRIERACRSPGAAEAHAAINGEDSLFYARCQWHELLHGAGDVRNPAADVGKVLGCLITDSRNVYDKLVTAVLTIKGAEKRTNIEMVALKESQEQTGLVLRWVHSEAQLANALTKRGNCKELELFYNMGHCWKIVEDPEMRSARRRRVDGELPLSSKGE